VGIYDDEKDKAKDAGGAGGASGESKVGETSAGALMGNELRAMGHDWHCDVHRTAGQSLRYAS
jgi:hypothetical protein